MPATVSVVVPVHNGARFIPDTLAAVLAQTLPADEIIVVDDGSRDDSAAIARAAAPLARLLTSAAVGVSAARNAGLAASRGTFVCFLDQDDIWHPRHLERQLAAFAAWPQAGAVVCPYHHWYAGADGYAEPQTIWAHADTDTDTDVDTIAPPIDPDFSGWVYHQFLLDCWALTSATMIRREALDEVGAFDAARPYGEDWELWLRLSRAWPFVKLNVPPVLYRQHPNQGSRRARDIDHRSELLLAAERAHGLASRDGRAVPARLFQQTLARYRTEFGLHHLMHGDAAIGRRALWQAWRRDPARLRVLALAAAAAAGWRPRNVALRGPAAST